ncbi:hypothetical protein MMC11_007063 [Xylographa trunciseda]|nr:hypothetical protein [Xylographa trunciseda]
MPGSYWTEPESRLLTFLKTGNFFSWSEIATRMITAEKQISFGTVDRVYNKNNLGRACLSMRKDNTSLYYRELILLDEAIPGIYAEVHLMAMMDTIKANKGKDATAIAEVARGLAVFRQDTIDALENYYWALWRDRAFPDNEPGEPRSWPVAWMFYLVDGWKLLKQNGGTAASGKVIDYATLAYLMGQKIMGVTFSAFDIEKAELQAIKWGFLRSSYANTVIDRDGLSLKVNHPLTEPTPAPEPAPHSRYLVSLPPLYLAPPMNQIELTRAAETTTIPAYAGLSYMTTQFGAAGPVNPYERLRPDLG